LLELHEMIQVALYAAQLQALCGKTLDLLDQPPYRLAIIQQGMELAKAISDIVDPVVKEGVRGDNPQERLLQVVTRNQDQ